MEGRRGIRCAVSLFWGKGINGENWVFVVVLRNK